MTIKAMFWVCFFNSLGSVESSHNAAAFNKAENAIGLYQIRPIYVRDANRILGYQVFEHKDAWNPEAAEEIIKAVTAHYGKNAHDSIETTEDLIRVAVMYARTHNGGARGARRDSTLKYAEKFEKHLKQYLWQKGIK